MTALLALLARKLALQPDEVRRALMLAGLLFALTCSYTLVKTARDAFFLSSLPAGLLPYVFLGVGVATLVASVLFARATGGRSTSETLAGAALVSSLVLALFAWVFQVDRAWGPIVFYVWVNLYGLILLSQFWAYINSVSNPHEAKRIYGVIGVGGVLGGLVGGLLAAPLAQGFGLPALVLVAGALLAAVALRVRGVIRHAPALPIPPPPLAADAPGERLARHPYVRWLALAALCSVLVTSLLDFAFKVEIQQRFHTPAELASFLGAFYTVVNLASLAFTFFISRWALQVLGAGWSAAVLPAGIALGAAVSVFVPVFIPVISTRLWDQVVRQSLNRSAVELFYFPLEPGLRRRAKALIEAGLERVGDALAGLVILALGATAGLGERTLAALLLSIIAIWAAAWLGVRRGYVHELARNLRRMNLGHLHEPVSLREASLLKEMTGLLDSRYERVVLHGMELMESNAPELLDAQLPELVGHASAAVRARALALIGVRNLDALHPRVMAAMDDPDPAVRAAALRTYSTLGRENPSEAIEGFLESEDPQLRAAALEMVIDFATPAEEDRVRARLEQLVQKAVVAERVAIAEALGRRPPASALHDLLGPLLRDPDLAVRRAALVAAGGAQRRSYLPILLDALAERPVADAARRGLVACGDKVVGTLGDYLTDSSVPTDLRHAIPRVLCEIASQEAVNALLRYRDTHDVRLWYRVLKALNKVRASGARVQFPRARLTEDLGHDARSWMFAYVHYRACPIGSRQSAERLFCIALNERIEQALNRVFRRLALLYPAQDMLAAYQGITSEDPRAHGHALEYLENALSPDHRVIVMALVGDASDEDRVRSAAQLFGIRFESFERTLEAVLQDDDQWLRVCALYVVGARRERTLLPRVLEALSSIDPRVRETANWATLALAGGN